MSLFLKIILGVVAYLIIVMLMLLFNYAAHKNDKE